MLRCSAPGHFWIDAIGYLWAGPCLCEGKMLYVRFEGCDAGGVPTWQPLLKRPLPDFAPISEKRAAKIVAYYVNEFAKAEGA